MKIAKCDRANISPEELMTWRKIAKALLTAPAAVQAAIDEEKLVEVLCDENPIP